MRRIILCCLSCLAAVAASAGSLNWIGDRLWGFSLSYSMKWYTYSSGGSRNRVNYFGEGGPMQGIRFGVPFEPVFYRGIGLSTGIFGEVYSCKNDAETKRIELVGLYFPVHAMYRYRLSRSCAERGDRAGADRRTCPENHRSDQLPHSGLPRSFRPGHSAEGQLPVGGGSDRQRKDIPVLGRIFCRPDAEPALPVDRRRRNKLLLD